MTIKVKASKELFERWQKVGRIIGNLASIVQNDMEVEIEDIAEWEEMYHKVEEKLKLVHQETMDYLQANDESFTYQLLQAEAKLALNNLEKEQLS